MARPQTIEDPALAEKLECVFRDVGYEAASLALLSSATGLKRASLYHRFPGGKEQMAREVLDRALDWVTRRVLAPLQDTGAPRERLKQVVAALDEFYQGGARACLLNLFGQAHAKGIFTEPIKLALQALVEGFAGLARDSGVGADRARLRGERAVALLQGSLVLSRGLGTSEPFRRMLKALPDEIFGSSPLETNR